MVSKRWNGTPDFFRFGVNHVFERGQRFSEGPPQREDTALGRRAELRELMVPAPPDPGESPLRVWHLRGAAVLTRSRTAPLYVHPPHPDYAGSPLPDVNGGSFFPIVSERAIEASDPNRLQFWSIDLFRIPFWDQLLERDPVSVFVPARAFLLRTGPFCFPVLVPGVERRVPRRRLVRGRFVRHLPLHRTAHSRVARIEEETTP